MSHRDGVVGSKKEVNNMKLSVIYDSKTGNTELAAEWIAEGMNSIDNVEAKAFSIHEIDEEFVKASGGIVIGSPSYMATLTPDLHAFMLASAHKLGFGGKLAGAFATEQFTHGGGETVIQAILCMELVIGMLCYSGGASKGKPVIHLGPVGVNANVEEHSGMDKFEEYFKIYGERFAAKAAELFG